MEYSGASLAFKYFSPKVESEVLAKYVLRVFCFFRLCHYFFVDACDYSIPITAS